VLRGAALLVTLVVSGCVGGDGTLSDPRTAGDCVAFTKEASAEAGEPSRAVFAPGTPPTVAVEAYWFGPTLGPRRAIVATEQEVSLPDAAGGVLPVYAVFYQLPADGCQSGLLPGYEEAPDYWGAGREVQVLSEPADAPAAQRWIRDRFGGLEGKPSITLRGGEEATVLRGDAETGIVVGNTLVTVTGAGVSRLDAVLDTLRPVGEPG
jgi:hypothetical protein